MPDVTEERLGKYRLLKLLASGGMGEVFLAKIEGPAGFARTVVVKRILKHLSSEPAFVQMFLDEARVAAQLSHPNIIQIIELGEHEGTWFIAMEYVHGLSARALRQQLGAKNEVVPPLIVARIMSQALQGLHHAHTATNEAGRALGIIHRDVSPDNVMIGFNGGVKMLDFGIAKASDAITTTRTGTVKGKYAYMSPEQLLAEPLDARADVYSAGVVMYELLCGERPFTAPAEPALVRKILDTPLPPLLEKAPQLPPELAALATMALEKDRENRFATAEHFALALDAWAVAQPLDSSLTLPAFMRSRFATPSGEFPALSTPSGSQPTGKRAAGLISIGSALNSSPDAPTQHLDRDARRRQALRVLGTMGLVAAALVVAVRVLHPAGEPRPAPAGGDLEVPDAAGAAAAPISAAGLAADQKTAEPAEPAIEEATLIAEPAPEQPPGAPAPRPVPHGKGKLDLRVNPWAEVLEGSRSFGLTPFAPLELPAGPHVLVLKNPKLDVTRKVKVVVAPGRTTVMRVDLLE